MIEPPKGSIGGPGAINIPVGEIGSRLERAVGGRPIEGIPQDHVGYQPPHDALEGTRREQTRIVLRDLPVTQTVLDWSVDQIRGALHAHNYGMFFQSGLLTDAILGDPRIQATLTSLVASLFGREVIFEPANDSLAAKEALDAWVPCWPGLSPNGELNQTERYCKMMGWSPAQLLWDTTGEIWKPVLRPWHMTYTYYHWEYRSFVAVSRDGPIAIQPGNGKWVVHFGGNGEYRSWIAGAVRAVSEPWLLRHQSFRDHARFNEVHGMPIRKAVVPAASAEDQRDAYAAALSRLGRETTVMVSRGVDGDNGYDLELVEAKDTAWEAFPGLTDRCDMDIVLAILTQNLTTEVKSGGSFAASNTHEKGLARVVAGNNAAWCGRKGEGGTIRNQIARPFAWLNFGDPDLAPKTRFDVPEDDYGENADRFLKFGTAVEVLRRGGIEFTDEDELRRFASDRFGLRSLPRWLITQPVSSGGMGGGK